MRYGVVRYDWEFLEGDEGASCDWEGEANLIDLVDSKWWFTIR